MEKNSVPKRVSVVVIHPCELIRHGIGLILQQSVYDVPYLLGSSELLLKKSDVLDIDIVLLHYSLYKPGGITKKVIDRTGANIVLLASSDFYHHDSYQDILGQIKEGITGFLDMDEPMSVFLSEMADIASGDIVISKNFKKSLTQKNVGIEDKLYKNFSNREMEVLNLLSNGSTNKEIGEELFISEHTVKVHLRSLLAKLNLKNRQQIVAHVIRKGLVNEYNPSKK